MSALCDARCKSRLHFRGSRFDVYLTYQISRKRFTRFPGEKTTASEVAHSNFLPLGKRMPLRKSQSIRFFATLGASTDVTALLRNNSRTEEAPFASRRENARERRVHLSPPRRSLKSVLAKGHDAVLAQFINGRIHRPSGKMYEATP